MSKLETKISELERELALKKGFQAVKFVLPKALPDDVSTEIHSKLREIADGLALSKEQIAVDYGSLEVRMLSQFTEEEITTLKMLAETVLKKAINPSSTPLTALSGTTNASSVPTVAPTGASPGGSSVHVPTAYKAAPKKAKILTAENVRGEGRKFATPDDEVFVSNPEKVDEHGMVSATHMRKGVMIKIPLDDIEFFS